MSAIGKPRVLADARTRPLLGRLLREHVRPQRRRLAFALACMAVTAAATAALARQMQPFLDQILAHADFASFASVVAGVFVLFVIKGIASYGQAVTMTLMGQRIVADLQRLMVSRLVGADLAFHHANPPGQLISRCLSDTSVLRGAVSSTLTSIGKESLTLVFLIGLMFYQDWRLALVTFFVLPLALAPAAVLGWRARRLARRSQEEMGNVTAALDEAFQGIRQVKAYGMEAHELGRVGATIEKLFRLSVQAGRTRALAHPMLETLAGIAIVAVMLYGGHQVVSGANTPGAFLSFIAALLLALEPIKRLTGLNADLQSGLAAAERIFVVADMQPVIVDRPGVRPLRLSAGAIAFERVSFDYGVTGAAPALDEVSLSVPAGATVALVGPSGAGKSTVLNLIPRFFDPKAGRIAIDGQDLRDVTLASLRAALAVVSQDGILFDDTVRANILYGRPDASEAAVIAAATAADAHGFIQALPRGYGTPVGPRGVRLSGGQCQRVAIARAMLRNAPILLLDEATSALDSETERQVQTALRRLVRGRTTLVIAHRLSTVIAADRIFVLDRGRVVDGGSHAELLARGGLYARLYALQFATDDDAAAARDGRRALG